MLLDPVGFTAYALDVALFVAAWSVLAIAVAVLYVQLCRLADRRTAEVEEMRELLTLIGRERREAQLAAMIANADALVAEVKDARAIRRILRDVRRAPLVAVEDIERLPEVG